MSEILRAIAARSTTRGYAPEKLTDEQVKTLIEAGLQAPTAANRQEIHFTAVPGDCPLLAELEQEKNALANAAPPVNFYYNAPVVLFLSGDAAFPWTAVDAGIAVENIALAAEGLGLGSVIIGCVRDAMLGEKKEHFAQALHFPAGYQFQVAIAVGHKAAAKEPHAFDWDKNVSLIAQKDLYKL